MLSVTRDVGKVIESKLTCLSTLAAFIKHMKSLIIYVCKVIGNKTDYRVLIQRSHNGLEWSDNA
jgi:hypothetical protein